MPDIRYYPVPSAVRDIDLARHAVIEASAGTGKTYTIEHLVAALVIEGGVEIENILVVTFTEKAAREIRERVRAVFSKIVASSNPNPSGEGDWIIDDTARSRIERAQASFDRAAISTIHGFCNRVLREMAVEIGAELGASLLDDDHLFSRSWRACLREEILVDPELAEPTIEALHARGPRGLETWVRAAIDSGYLQRYGLFRAWARQKFDTWRSLFDAEALRPPTAAHGGADCDALREIDALASLDGCTIDEAWEAYLALSTAALQDTLRITSSGRPPRKNKGMTESLRTWVEVDAECALARPTPEHELLEGIVPLVTARFLRDKREAGVVDFDDMMTVLRDALVGPHRERVSRALVARYQWALIDEFQDTDAVQWDIFRAAFLEQEGARLMLIGDPKQAIYRFRGADVHVYRDAVEYLVRERNAQRLHLTHNFRSRPSVVDAYNALLEPDVAAPVFTGEVNRYTEPVKAGLDEADLRLVGPDDADVPPIVLMTWEGAAGAPIDRVRTEVAAGLASQLRSMLRGDGALTLVGKGGARRALKASDVFVLISGWNDAVPLKEAFDAAGIPWALLRAEGLMASAEARAMHTVLCALSHPSDARWALAAWHTPFFGVAVDELAQMREVDVEHPAFETLVRWAASAAEGRWAELFDAMLFESGLVRRLLITRDDERAVTNYTHLAELLAGYASQHRMDIEALATRVGEWITGHARLPDGANEQRLESERDAVQIMTMHASKGLEAPVVCCYGGFSAGRGNTDPFIRARLGGMNLVVSGDSRNATVLAAAKQEDIEEAQRLNYVAVTRASACLVLPVLLSKPVKEPARWAPMNARLKAVFDEHGGSPPGYQVVDATGASIAPDEAALARLASYVPERLGAPVPRVLEASRHRTAGRAARQMSYSSLKKDGQMSVGASGGDAVDPRADVADAAAEPNALVPAHAIDALPGGADLGLCLHYVAEHAPLERVAAAADAASLFADADFGALCVSAAQRHGIDVALAPLVCDAVYGMLRAPVALPDHDVAPGVRHGATLEGGLAAVDRMEREVEFLFALRGVEGSQGYIKGYVDAAVEHEGRWYVVDWKSDRVTHWTHEGVRDHVDEHYGVQRMLYLLALCRVLGVVDDEAWRSRMGGWVYVFARGVPRGVGVVTGCPTWAELVAFEATLTNSTGRRAAQEVDR